MAMVNKHFYFIICLLCHMSSQALVISLEGNCGVGKSTLAKILMKELETPPLTEQWSQWVNKPLFGLFLQDKQRWAYTMSHFISCIRFQAYASAVKEYQSAPLFILDRSVFTQMYAFSRMFYDEGSMSELEWQLFLQECGLCFQMLNYKIDGFIYVKTDVATAYERIQKRKPYDEYLSYAFLTALECYHERWLIQKDLIPGFACPPILVIDSTKDFRTDMQEQQRIIAQVRDFIATLS